MIKRADLWTQIEDAHLFDFVHGRRLFKFDAERLAAMTGRTPGAVMGRLALLRGRMARPGTRLSSKITAVEQMRKPAPEVVAVRPRQCIRTDCRVWHTPSSPYVFRCPRCQRLSAE